MTLQGVTGDVPIDWGFVKDDIITYRVRVPGQNGNVLFVYVGKSRNLAMSAYVNTTIAATVVRSATA